MKNRSNLILAVWAIFLGLYLLLDRYEIIETNRELVVGYSLTLFGITNFIFSKSGKSKLQPLLSTAAFLSGILITVYNSIEIIKPSAIMPFSLFFILGGIFFILFTESPKAKFPLFLSIVFWSISWFVIYNDGNIVFNFVYNNMYYMIHTFWPVLIILLGISFLIKKK